MIGLALGGARKRRTGSRRPPPLKIAVSTHTFFPTVGGAEVGIHEIYRRIAHTHLVTVLTPAHRDGLGNDPPAADTFEAGYRLAAFGGRARAGIRAIIGRIGQRTGVPQALALLRLSRTTGVDVVNCHFVKRNALVAVMARYVLRVPVVLSLVGRPDVLATLRRSAKWRALLVMKSADVLIAISGYCLAGSPLQTRALIIPYGVDTESFRPNFDRVACRDRLGYEPENFVLLAVQRLTDVKRVDILIRALARVLVDLPGARLVVVGTGPAEDDWRALAERLGVGYAVYFCGYVETQILPTLFGAADIFVSHSEFETFGVVFAEAMSAGLPIVAADTSCVRWVLNEESSVVVDPYDVEAFAAAVTELATNPGRRNRMAVAAREKALSEFEWDAIAWSYRHALEQAAGLSLSAVGEACGSDR